MTEAAVLARLIGALLSEFPDAKNDVNGARGSLAEDLTLLAQAMNIPGRSMHLRLWNSAPCVVVTRSIASRAGFTAACRALESEGWSIGVRASGGTAVVHRPGVLNISLAYAEADAPVDVNSGYARLTQLICNALSRLAINAGTGSAAGSFCDGKHNIVWRGRKLAGTAATVRRRGNITGYLVHASLTAWGNVADDIAAIQRLEASCGIHAAYDPRAHVTLAEILAVSGETP